MQGIGPSSHVTLEINFCINWIVRLEQVEPVEQLDESMRHVPHSCPLKWAVFSIYRALKSYETLMLACSSKKNKMVYDVTYPIKTLKLQWLSRKETSTMGTINLYGVTALCSIFRQQTSKSNETLSTYCHINLGTVWWVKEFNVPFASPNA